MFFSSWQMFANMFTKPKNMFFMAIFHLQQRTRGLFPAHPFGYDHNTNKMTKNMTKHD